MYSQFRDSASQSNLNDYYDQIPPAHRLSELSTNNTPLTTGSATNIAEPYSDADIPRTRAHFGDRRGVTDNPFSEEKTMSRSRKRWVVGGLACFGLLLIIGIVVGVVVSKTHKSTNTSSSNSGSGSGSSGSQKGISGDPSSFTKDSRLKQSFYGIAYTPQDSIYPNCNIQLADVITDMQLLSQLTTRIRLYGSDCNTTAMVLEAITRTKVNMTVFIANYPDATDNGTAYNRQKAVIQSAIQTYGTDHISGLTVGNEFILNYLDANGGTDPNSAVGNQGAAILTPLIDDSKAMLKSLGVSMKIGNADAGSFFNNKVLADVDYGMANVHPWFANVSINDAAAWTWSFFEDTDIALAQSLSNKPEMSIAETGWPTKSSDAGNASNGPSLASEANLQIFMDTFVCQANTNGTEYFFFEYFDEPWKDKQFGGVEGWWGLFNSNRTLKNIEIPSC